MAGHLAKMRERKNAYSIWVGELVGKHLHVIMGGG
jgi:hypothetical protein